MIFLNKELGKAIPYGVYDLASNEGWVSVGIDHDTLASPRQAFGGGGRDGGQTLSACHQLMITADGGGSNGSRIVFGRSLYNNWPTT